MTTVSHLQFQMPHYNPETRTKVTHVSYSALFDDRVSKFDAQGIAYFKLLGEVYSLQRSLVLYGSYAFKILEPIKGATNFRIAEVVIDEFDCLNAVEIEVNGTVHCAWGYQRSL